MRSFIFNCLFWGISAVFAIVCYLVSFLPGRALLVACMVGYCRTIRLVMHAVAGIRLEVRGNIPANQPVILAAKHQSYADGPMMMALLGDVNFVIGNAIEKFPMINRIVRRAGATMVNTQGNATAPDALQVGIRRSLGENRPILIYPEGGLAAVGETRRYRKGVAVIYDTLDRPIIPVATNIGLRWQQEDWEKTPGTAVIEFLDPIPPGLPRANLMQCLQDKVETRTRELEAEGRNSEENG